MHETIIAAQHALTNSKDYDELAGHAKAVANLGQEFETPDLALLRGYLLRKAEARPHAASIFRAAVDQFPRHVQLLYEAMLSSIDADEHGHASALVRQLSAHIGVLPDPYLQGLWRGASMVGLHDVALEAFRARSSRDFANPNLEERILTAIDNQSFACVADVRVISVGDNCFPWMVANRWGLRANTSDKAEDSIFNLGQCAPGTAAGLIAGRMGDLIDMRHLSVVRTPTSTPMPVHASGFQFNHQQGAEWCDGDFRMLRDRYTRKIENFQHSSGRNGRVYLHYAEKEGVDLNVLVAAIEAMRGGDMRYHIVIIDPKASGNPPRPHPRVTYSSQALPYPDYVWFMPTQYDLDLGINFERGVCAVIRSAMEHVMARSVSRA